ncbi:unnamed protein product [Auanema sp. JU1783]|nr:unnamed protein product [Auanema sp. JU1783]
MGVTGLWPLLEPSCTPVTLESLEGKKLAVDVSIWIYQAQLGYSSETKNPHLALLMNRIAKLLFYKIRPVFVFDGPGVPDLKRRVLNARRAERLNQDMLFTKNKKRHLEEVARGQIDGENVDKAMKKLTSPNKKFKDDMEMFNIPSTSHIPVYDVSDDDAEIVVEKEVRPKTKSDLLNHLIDVKEHLRVSRLHPDMIPKETDDFCKFQLQRVLQRGNLSRTIKKLSKNELDDQHGSQVKIAVNDHQGNAHVITYDSDVQLVDEPHETERISEVGLQGNCLSDICEIPSTTSNEHPEQDEHSAEYYFSKTSMIEKLMKQRIGKQNAQAIRVDNWSSDSSYDDDEFIDVPNGIPVMSQAVASSSKSEEKKEDLDDAEWNPSLEGDNVVPIDRPSLYDEPRDRDRDSGAYADIQEFLTKCGFPWVEAPGEAEAQCVELERLGLVQGVVSDDSDVWAFGVQNVYRHLFSTGKNVQHYNSEKVNNDTGLSQEQFIMIAVISGGDYSVGFHGVGVVSAVELIAEFTKTSSFDSEKEKNIMAVLCSVDEWLKFSEEEKRTDNTLLRKIRKIIMENNDLTHLQMSDKVIVKAYLHPSVDSSTEVFRWRGVDIDGVKQLLYERVGWDDDKFSKNALQSLEKWNAFILRQTSYQRHITSYACPLTQSADEQRISLSKRAITALDKLKSRTSGVVLPELQLQGDVAGGLSVGSHTRAKPLRSTRQRKTSETKKGNTKAVPKTKPVARKTSASAAKKPPASAAKKEDLNLSESSDSDM